jgi:hypothetical protein
MREIPHPPGQAREEQHERRENPVERVEEGEAHALGRVAAVLGREIGAHLGDVVA